MANCWSAKTQSIPIDLVRQATPSGLHSGQVIGAAEAGMHVCTGKADGDTLADGLAMGEACDVGEVHLFVEAEPF